MSTTPHSPTTLPPLPPRAKLTLDLCDIMLDQITLNLSSKLVPTPEMAAKLAARRSTRNSLPTKRPAQL